MQGCIDSCCTYAVRLSPTLNESPEIIEHSDTIKIHYRAIFNFYPRLYSVLLCLKFNYDTCDVPPTPPGSAAARKERALDPGARVRPQDPPPALQAGGRRGPLGGQRLRQHGEGGQHLPCGRREVGGARGLVCTCTCIVISCSIYSGTSLKGHSEIRTPLYYGHFAMSQMCFPNRNLLASIPGSPHVHSHSRKKSGTFSAYFRECECTWGEPGIEARNLPLK